MDYLTCSSSSVQADILSEEVRACSPPPPFVESSCSEQSELSDKVDSAIVELSSEPPIPPLKAGEVSPSSICAQRKLSTAITTNPEVKHPVLEGRPTLVLQSLCLDSKTPSKMTLPKAPRSGPTRQSFVNGHHTTSQRSIAPLPDLPKPRKLHRSHTAPVEPYLGKFRTFPAPLRLDAWSEPAAENFQVRGANYMNDRQKFPSEESAFQLLCVDLINSEKALYDGICAHPGERFQLALQREEATGIRELPEFVFCINLCVPGPPFYHKVSYFGVNNMDEIRNETTAFGRLMNRFIFGDSDEFRNETFKLIPRIVEGNFVVRKAVGSKPSILGKKIKQYYIRNERYFEVIVDIASDTVAQRIVKLALGYTKTMVVDMMFLLEGNDEETLPERILGGVRMKNIDFKDKDGKRSVAVPEEQ